MIVQKHQIAHSFNYYKPMEIQDERAYYEIMPHNQRSISPVSRDFVIYSKPRLPQKKIIIDGAHQSHRRVKSEPRRGIVDKKFENLNTTIDKSAINEGEEEGLTSKHNYGKSFFLKKPNQREKKELQFQQLNTITIMNGKENISIAKDQSTPQQKYTREILDIHSKIDSIMSTLQVKSPQFSTPFRGGKQVDNHIRTLESELISYQELESSVGGVEFSNSHTLNHRNRSKKSRSKKPKAVAKKLKKEVVSTIGGKIKTYLHRVGRSREKRINKHSGNSEKVKKKEQKNMNSTRELFKRLENIINNI